MEGFKCKCKKKMLNWYFSSPFIKDYIYIFWMFVWPYLLYTYSVIVKVLRQCSRVISERMRDPFKEIVWNNFFSCAIQFITQVSLISPYWFLNQFRFYSEIFKDRNSSCILNQNPPHDYVLSTQNLIILNYFLTNSHHYSWRHSLRAKETRFWAGTETCAERQP